MKEVQTVQLIAMIGWLILVGSALASYRFSWGKGLTMALAWSAIFGGVFVLFNLIGGQ
ncbi:hypothetical protein IM511_00885 [Erythrobacteraceae bacterium E2-1 Yellow Sea]|nr:hypothetical protein [Erythrobacteraceae bacterium E2-1 Yellow Sea]